MYFIIKSKFRVNLNKKISYCVKFVFQNNQTKPLLSVVT